MVYTNTVKMHISDARYSDEMWRAKHGYKEIHQHDAPIRRNRDFKPVPWGAAVGMPNYRHAEPFLLLKNIKDIKNEHAHHPTKWAKTFLAGSMWGFVFGQAYHLLAP